MSTSCSSLKKSGVFKSGYYNIKPQNETILKSVFCDMESGNYEDVEESQETIMNLSPVGTILPWVPKPVKDDSVTGLTIPDGWARCDGSIIPPPSIWAGKRTPDLNNEMRFLRGAPDDSVLTLEEDQLMDHTHKVSDAGHNHGYGDRHQKFAGSQHHDGESAYKHDTFDESRTTKKSVTGLMVQGITDSYRKGDENRPRNMHITYIMRIF